MHFLFQHLTQRPPLSTQTVRLIAPPGATLGPMGMHGQQIIASLPSNSSLAGTPIVLSSAGGQLLTTNSSGHPTHLQNHMTVSGPQMTTMSPQTRLPNTFQATTVHTPMSIGSNHLHQIQQPPQHPSPIATPPIRTATPKSKATPKQSRAKERAEAKKNAAAAAAANAAGSGMASGGVLFPGATPGAPGEKSASSFRDDDDINDVAAMGGVNLQEESQRILAGNAEIIGQQIRSCKDETFLYGTPLHSKINSICKC